MQLIKSLQWRYAVKKFDSRKKVGREDLDLLKEAIRLTPSSYGLQPYKILIIENAGLKEKLKPFSYNQPQITDASHLFVFLARTRLDREYLEHLFRLKAEIQGKSYEDLKEYAERLITKFGDMSREELLTYTSNQTFMALETLIDAAAELKIDTCPIGGFIPEKYDEILGLKGTSFTTVVVCAVGYRSNRDKNRLLPKFRLPTDELFDEI